jgi:hypothetical protein
VRTSLRLTTLGVGAANSPRYRPAGLLIEARGGRVMIDGGRGADPAGELDAWLVTDERAELISGIRGLAFPRQLVPRAARFQRGYLRIEPRSVVHTSHPTWGYLIVWGNKRVAWAPEFFRFPGWATGADLMFAEAAGWSRPIRFAGGVGGHLDVLAVARSATSQGVRRLVFVHIGRPTIRAIDRGDRPPFGEFAKDGQVFIVRGADPAQVRRSGPPSLRGRLRLSKSASERRPPGGAGS